MMALTANDRQNYLNSEMKFSPVKEQHICFLLKADDVDIVYVTLGSDSAHSVCQFYYIGSPDVRCTCIMSS